MEQLDHLNHRHPLVLKEIQRDEDDVGFCQACTKPILGPTYCCSQCYYFLHKRCEELPLEVQDPIHQHHLALKYFPSNTLYGPLLPLIYCFCGKARQGFNYHCSTCDFTICISCFMTDRNMITHKSHEHPLVPLLRPVSVFCDICGMRKKEVSYLCVPCQFCIHKSCALLPITINRTDHHHPLILGQKFTQFTQDCYICDEPVKRCYWAYYCVQCIFSIHVKCPTSSSTPSRGRENESMDQKYHDPDVLHLPTSCLVEHLHVEKIEGEPKIDHWSHEHSLTLFTMQNNNEINDKTILCDSCVQPISHPFYCCALCDYFLHLNCVNLSRMIQHPFHEHPIQLSKSSEFYPLTGCDACESHNNGFFYKCDTCEWFSIDVKCALLPTSIVHEAHKHSLSQRSYGTPFYCNACGFFFYSYRFTCSFCRFELCYNCASLPQTVKQRWHRHPLILSHPPFFDHPQEFYCDFCEEEINTRHWIYHCRECDQSCHPHCIHRKYRNVKFGSTCEFKDHPHPLKFLQNAVKQFTCCYCGELSGDDPVLECLECYYMLCINCVEKHYK